MRTFAFFACAFISVLMCSAGVATLSLPLIACAFTFVVIALVLS